MTEPAAPAPGRVPLWIWSFVAFCVAAVAVVVTVVLATSRDRATAPSRPVAASSSPSPTEESRTQAQQSFLLDARLIYTADTDEAILELGDTICRMLDEGVAMPAAVESVTGLDSQSLLDLFFGATNYLCPTHVQSFIAYRDSRPPSISDGTWTVGTDLPPGRYRPAAPAGSDCYWAVLRSGSNGDDIINNNIGGGRPVVTLRAGQDFQTERCGRWELVK